jgi:zinc transporter 1/2/3
MIHFKPLALIIILVITVFAGILPFKKKLTSPYFDFPIGEAIACGVFLGAGLIHMLGDAASEFSAAGYHYPFAFLICGSSFLLLLVLEHISRELYEHKHSTTQIAILATIMLSVHSFLEGAALGISGSLATALILAIAIIAHKWAASFSLSLQINKSGLGFKVSIVCFSIFALMTPLGILLGDWVSSATGNAHLLLTPIFSALAAGTFLYIGTLHGLQRATMIERCCNLREFLFMLSGFALMAVVAIWT